MAKTSRPIAVATAAALTLSMSSVSYAQQPPHVECRGNVCHTFQQHDGSAYNWLQLGIGVAGICALMGCFGSLEGEPDASVRSVSPPRGDAPEPGYNWFDHIDPLPNYGKGE